jgi:antirestriction protein ArdC
LIAELGSAFLCAKTGITSTVGDSASYINSWLKVLKDDRKMIISASSMAEKAMEYIIKGKEVVK